MDDRAICQGAGEERRIMVGRGGGGEESGTVRLRCRQRTSNTAFSSDAPDNVVFSRKTSSIFSACSSSSSEPSWRIRRHSSSRVSSIMVGSTVYAMGGDNEGAKWMMGLGGEG